jgi:hypothetical protein
MGEALDNATIKCTEIVMGIAKRKKDHKMVMLMNIDAVFA